MSFVTCQPPTLSVLGVVGSNLDPELDELGSQEAQFLGRSIHPSVYNGGGVGSGAMKKLFNRRTSIAKSDNERMIFFHDIREVPTTFRKVFFSQLYSTNYKLTMRR